MHLDWELYVVVSVATSITWLPVIGDALGLGCMSGLLLRNLAQVQRASYLPGRLRGPAVFYWFRTVHVYDCCRSSSRKLRCCLTVWA